MVALLLSRGADVNQADGNGASPLYTAAFNDHDTVVAVLLSNGADVNQANNKGQKPIDVADNQKIKDMLIAHEKVQQQQSPPFQLLSNGQAVSTMVDESQWFQAAMMGDLAVIQQGINDKIDVNCRDLDGRTAVWLAVAEGHIPLTEYLINQHADLSIVGHVSDNDDILSISILDQLPLILTLTTDTYPNSIYNYPH